MKGRKDITPIPFFNSVFRFRASDTLEWQHASRKYMVVVSRLGSDYEVQIFTSCVNFSLLTKEGGLEMFLTFEDYCGIK